MKIILERPYCGVTQITERVIIKVSEKDFELERDEFTQLICDDCGSVLNDKMTSTCPNCGSEELIEETEHLGRECPLCGSEFEYWEDGYSYIGDEPILEEFKSELICQECYDSMKKGE